MEVLFKVKTNLFNNPQLFSRTHTDDVAKKHSYRPLLAFGGLTATAFMFAWLMGGLLGFTPSLIDVFGIEGLRIPAGIAIGGLLVSAIGFNKF